MLFRTIATLLLFIGGFISYAARPYPYPVHYLEISIEQQEVRLAYMDVQPESGNGHTIVLLHGKNFNGYYWKDIAHELAAKGYRVIIPDQVGWGRSDKPNLHYSFHMLARNTKLLLDELNVTSAIVVGHSMGGMLATRFALMYPEAVEKLVLEDPIGLEDYKTFIPYTPVAQLYKTEAAATYDSYKKYMQSYFPQWRAAYDELVAQQAAALDKSNFKETALANALTYQMIYEQPVCYEFKNINVPTLLVIGQADRTVVGKDKLSKDEQAKHGQYPLLGKAVHAQIKNSRLVELKGVGHIPHIQEPTTFMRHLLAFLKN